MARLPNRIPGRRASRAQCVARKRYRAYRTRAWFFAEVVRHAACKPRQKAAGKAHSMRLGAVIPAPLAIPCTGVFVPVPDIGFMP